MDLPTLETERLIIRPPAESDVPAMPGVFNDPDIYAHTRNIPYPYGEADARAAFDRYHRLARESRAICLFPEERTTGEIVGLVQLVLADGANEAELGYAIGRAWWGKGYATDASRAMLGYGFGTLGLDAIHAHAMVRNPASSRVLEKLGMRAVGVVEGLCEKDGEHHDAEGFVMVRSAWNGSAGGG
ncbi:MAG: GNAT family N-acetyltransferase [Phycisphaerales bacterium]